jgi:CHASE2 domain-containing sensor protein
VTEEHSEGSNTIRPNAGKAIRNPRGWPGYGAVMLGVILIALCVLAAGYGYEGWAWLSGIVGAVVLVLGALAVLATQRRSRPLDANRGPHT